MKWGFGVIFIITIGLIRATSAAATTVELQWDPITDPRLLGYEVHYSAGDLIFPIKGTGAIEGPSPISAQSNSTRISGLDPSLEYHFAVTAIYDTIGASGYSNIVTVLETLPPVIEITSPATNSFISAVVPIQVAATDNMNVARVEYYINGTLQHTDTETPYSYSWNTTVLIPGRYAITAKAFDTANNAAQSSTVMVSVVRDTSPPSVTLANPLNGSTISGVTDIVATVADNVGVTRVDLFIDGSPQYSSNVPPYTYRWNTTLLAEGTHMVSARAYDNSGNVSTASSVVSVKKPIATSACILDNLRSDGSLLVENSLNITNLNVGPITSAEYQQICGYAPPIQPTGDLIVNLSLVIGAMGQVTIGGTSPPQACSNCGQ